MLILNSQIDDYLNLEIFLFVKCTPTRHTQYTKLPHLYLKEEITFQTVFREEKYLVIYEPGKTEAGFFENTAMVRELVALLKFNNVYFSSGNVISYQYDRVLLWNCPHSYDKNMPTESVIYDSVVFLYGVWVGVFGHFLHDALPVLVRLPQELYNNSYITLNQDPELVYKFTDVLGYPREKFIFYHKSFVFARNLYVYRMWESVNGLSVRGCPYLYKIIREKFGCNKIEPTRYILSNRSGKRRIRNFKDVTEAIKKEIPEIPWETIVMPYWNVSEYSKILASTKIWFTPCGSNAINVFFMKENTGICLSMAKSIDLSDFCLGYICNIWEIGYVNWEMSHHNRRGGWSSIELPVRALKALLYALEHKAWPKLNNTCHPFDINATKRRMNSVYDVIQAKFSNDQMIY